MIQCGLEYSYITTGEAFVFLRIKEEDPTTLYYHVTVPNEEADMHEDPQSRVLHTAVGQVLSFCLLAMKSQQRSKEWQARAYRLLEKMACQSSLSRDSAERKSCDTSRIGIQDETPSSHSALVRFAAEEWREGYMRRRRSHV